MKSPVKYLSDSEFENLPSHERALILASSLIGKGEIPKNSNWGPFVKMLLNVSGLFGPAPWCAAFVYYCFVTTGTKRSSLWRLPASTASMIAWARRTGRLRESRVNRGLFVWFVPGRGGHTGFVSSVSGFVDFSTIEGNTNPGGSREGYGIFRRNRKTTQTPKPLFIDMVGIK